MGSCAMIVVSIAMEVAIVKRGKVEGGVVCYREAG